jgi:transcriptional regulator with XRE-family HTH domain
MPPNSRIDYEEVRRSHREGVTMRTLAARFGVSYAWISRIVRLEAGGPPSRPPALPEGIVHKIQKLRAAGLTFQAIGERLDLNPTTISKIARSAGQGESRAAGKD